MIPAPRRSPALSATPRVPLRLAVLSIAGFWILYFLLNSVRTSIEEGGWQWPAMGRRVFVTLAGMGLTFLLCLVLRRLEGRSMGVLVTTGFLAAIPVSIAYASVNYAAFYIIYPIAMAADEVDWHSKKELLPIAIICGLAFSWYFFIVAWSVLYIALSYATRVRHAERRAAEFRAAAQSAQLRALRYQINPHFLFNTLNSLSSLILSHRTDEAERMLMNLSTFFRTSLTSDPTEDVPLADEIRLQRLYLDIEKTRFRDRLKVQIDLPRALETVPVPALILQPLVENAIKHGVARSMRPVTIGIRAHEEGGRVRLTVEDDGEPAAAPAGGHGVGLRNVRERLDARFDGAAAFRSGQRPGGGFSVELTLPLAREAVPV
ncbi:MAG TPA: histidine kinase [Stellaceae bacterium]|nr:histidine kinase [Stellaceae bacterium]